MSVVDDGGDCENNRVDGGDDQVTLAWARRTATSTNNSDKISQYNARMCNIDKEDDNDHNSI